MKRYILIGMSLFCIVTLAACAAPAATPTPTAVPTESLCLDGSEICLTEPLTDAAISQPAPAAEAAESAPANRQLVAQGIGQVYLTPDMAYLYIGLNNQSDVLNEAMNLNSTNTEAIINAIQSLGISAEDIQTSNISVYPQNQYSPMGEISGTSYSIDNSVYVSVRELDQLNDVIQASLEAGANSVSGVQFDVKDKSDAMEEAQKLAIEDAKSQARLLAETTGVVLGELSNVSVTSSNFSGAQYYGGGYGGGGAGMMNLNQIPVSAGQMAVTVEATLVYEIK